MSDYIECIECGEELHAGTVCCGCAGEVEQECEQERIAMLQELIDSGLAWRLEGSVGRQCMRAIESGECMLGEHSHWDFYGNYIPARHEVKPGTKGSREYCEARGWGGEA